MAAPAKVLRPRPPAGPVHRGQSPWVPRILKGFTIFLAVCVVAAGVAYVYLRHQLGKINRLDIPGLSSDAAGSVMNVLLVGSDSRERLEGDLAEATGKDEVSGQRSDTMMVLHIDGKQQKASIVSIPRDLYVPIADTDYSDKINTAFAMGGAPQLIQTIQDSLGIVIHHYVEVDFGGFERIVNTIGGVKVYFDAPARDEVSGLDIPEAGCVELDGYQALAFVRSRSYETYEGGEWVADPTSDLGRIQRQQDFIRRMMKKAVSTGLTNPIALNRLVGIGVDNVTLDQDMSTKDIVTVARRFRSLDPETVEMRTLPTVSDFVGDADVQLLNEEEAQPIIDILNGKGTDDGSVRTSDVQVRVLNGYGADGAAAKTAFALGQAGFAITGTGDADSFAYGTTVIRHAPGRESQAELLQSYLQAGAVLEEDDSLGTADLALVVGSDYAGVRPGPGAVGPDTTSPPTAEEAPSGEKPDPKGASQPAC